MSLARSLLHLLQGDRTKVTVALAHGVSSLAYNSVEVLRAFSWRASVSGDPDGAHPGSHGDLERIALFARQTMVVVGSIDVEMPVY